MRKACYPTFKFILLSGIALLLCMSDSRAVTTPVYVFNYVFSPTPVNINLGDSIKWVWVNGKHSTTSLSVPPGAAKWDMSIDSLHPSFIYVPAVAGTYTYRSKPSRDSIMKGVFTVTCPSPSAAQAAITATPICLPTPATLTVATAGLKYQWKNNDVKITGATNQTYITSGGGSFKCSVNNGCGAKVSNTIPLVVNNAPQIPELNVTDTVTKCPNESIILITYIGPDFSYNWYKNGLEIPGGTMWAPEKITVTEAGVYTVKVTDVNTGCSSLSPPVTVVNKTCRMGVEEFVIYPNPSAEVFNFTTAMMETTGSVSIYDLTGKLIEYLPFDYSDVVTGNDLSEGIYIAKVKIQGREDMIVKLVKSR